jgi:hypothetical protein
MKTGYICLVLEWFKARPFYYKVFSYYYPFLL